MIKLIINASSLAAFSSINKHLKSFFFFQNLKLQDTFSLIVELYGTPLSAISHKDKKKKNPKSIDRRATCINISDEMIDDRIFKSLWHCRKKKLHLPPSVTNSEGPPGRKPIAAAVGGVQRKLGQIKVIKDLQINTAFILDLLSLLGSHGVSRKMEGGCG